MIKINFKQPKYIFPLVIFVPLCALVYFVMQTFSGGEETAGTVATDRINMELPQANAEEAGDKMYEMSRRFGDEDAFTAVSGIGEEKQKKEELEHGYSEEELNRLDHITFSDKKSWMPELNDANADSAKRFAQDVNAQLTQTSALGAINAMMSEGDVAIGAAGSLPGDMQRMWRPTGIDTYNMEYGYSTMGYEVAGALGVKLAIGDKHEVYSFCGDGSFNMLHGELITACQEHKKINICLFDNASFGCINNLQVGHGNVTLCTELRYRNKDGLFGNFMNIDYAKVAEAYGCKSYTVRTMEELVAAFEDAKKVKNIPVLFDIKVLPKTMTDGYSSWWRVGDTEVSERKENLAAYADLQAHLKEVRKY